MVLEMTVSLRERLWLTTMERLRQHERAQPALATRVDSYTVRPTAVNLRPAVVACRPRLFRRIRAPRREIFLEFRGFRAELSLQCRG